MTPTVHFTPETAASSEKHSRPARKRSVKVPQVRPPSRSYAIKLPWKDMLARAAERDPEVLKLCEGNFTQLRWTLEDEAITLCERAQTIWPNAFVPILDDKGFPTCLDCLGLADNTHRDKARLPSDEEVQEIRNLLDLNGEQYELGWFREPDPEFRTWR